MKTIEGVLDARGVRFAIVLGRFNSLIGERLLEGAIDCLDRHGADADAITVVRVPGAFEIPLVAARLAAHEQYDAVICLGAVIRGSTPHFEYVANEAAKGIAHAALNSGKPVIFGVLTCDTIEQALERAGTKAGNKGWDAAMAAIETADVVKKIG
ncbi:MAG: 6,7-dimethyl-8-ribityllumazine synthase [Spirochaetaceae bacterium]|nr:MAG: 6,7-dimethyl-8-ribityllumazine synthase [Spirochaetaceae bacterium]